MARVLIVDDASIMRNILSVMLEKAGHDIAGTAANGIDALELYKQLQPDLVTLDIQMADGDGISFLKKITRIDSNAKVVMVSALGDSHMKEEALSCGAAGYVSKPFQVNQLLAEIQTALAGSG